MLILDLLGISFHAVVIFGVGKDLLLKYVLGRCETGSIVAVTAIAARFSIGINFLAIATTSASA